MKADYKISKSALAVLEEICFVDQSTGSVDSWLWDFGDGSFSAEQNPKHTYKVAGGYTVKLEVAGQGTSNTKIGYITVEGEKITADFLLPQPKDVSEEIRFTDRSQGNITSWLWDFGDGNTSDERDPTYIYRSPGQYTVTLKVTGVGGTSTKAKIVSVKAANISKDTNIPSLKTNNNSSSHVKWFGFSVAAFLGGWLLSKFRKRSKP
ncbi:MAG: PKD domain-containing protein [Phycisphaerae bacterium]|nr:PKD domain-containing protein [Phycisphaerae bacterium]MDD5380569.1 PKD domain-containing protein [Phycisphaerae bacterium]